MFKCNHCYRRFDNKSDARQHVCAGSSRDTLDSIVDIALGIAVGSLLSDDYSSSDDSSSSFSTSSDNDFSGGGGSFDGGGSSDSW